MPGQFRAAEPLRPAARAHIELDLCVHAATPAGCIAAIAAARHGKRVAILGGWREVMPGGMMSGGLGHTDVRNTASIGGIALEWWQRTWDFYGREPGAWFNFEPIVALRTFEVMLDEAGVQCIWNRGIVAASADIVGRDRYLRKVVTRDGLTVSARQWIDASYEGDLMRVAGATMVTGRESQAEFGEDNAGVRIASVTSKPTKHWQKWRISPFRVAGEPGSGLMDGIMPAPTEAIGDGNPIHTQAYNFRLSGTRNVRDGLPLPTQAPPRFNPRLYEPLLRYLEVSASSPPALGDVFLIDRVNERGHCDLNNNGIHSTDWNGASWDYITPDYDERERVWKAHEDYTRGFLWVLWGLNDSRVPASLRAAFRAWRLAGDQFYRHHPNDEPHWPTQLYVREYARLRGIQILREQDVTRADALPVPYASSVIAQASYWIDSHAIRKVALQDPNGNWVTWPDGGFLANAGGRNQLIPVPFEVMLPRRHELANVSSVWCVSGTHVAISALRLEPAAMCMGHAAGLAAVMALDGPGDVALDDLSRADLRAQLRAEGAVIDGV